MEFIAEIGMNYNQNKGLIPEMVRLASNAGADYAKLQRMENKLGEINNLLRKISLISLNIVTTIKIKPLFQ